MFIIGSPVVIFCLVRKTTVFFENVNVEHLVEYVNYKRGQKEKQLPPVEGAELNELKWNMRVALVPSSVESLYFSYKYKWRYYKLLSILERLALSFVNTLVATIVSAIIGTTWSYAQLFVIVFNVIIHGISSLLKLFVRPNTYCFENFLLIFSTFFNFLNSLFALVVFIVQETVSEASAKTRATQILSICAYVVISAVCTTLLLLIFSRTWC